MTSFSKVQLVEAILKAMVSATLAATGETLNNENVDKLITVLKTTLETYEGVAYISMAVGPDDGTHKKFYAVRVKIDAEEHMFLFRPDTGEVLPLRKKG